MKNQGFILALILSMGLLFSCSGSEDDDPLLHPLPNMYTAKDVFHGYGPQNIQEGDSMVIRSIAPFYIGDLQYEGIPLTNGQDSPNLSSKSAFQYQKIKLDWLTLIHPTDSTLILKVDSDVGFSSTILVYAGLIGPQKTTDGKYIVALDNCISVTRVPAKVR
jgi:hypothetical protein